MNHFFYSTIIILICIIQIISGYLNLYLNLFEVQRLLGEFNLCDFCMVN